jgi:hypothetical protein
MTDLNKTLNLTQTQPTNLNNTLDQDIQKALDLDQDIQKALDTDDYKEVQLGDVVYKRNEVPESKQVERKHDPSYVPIQVPTVENIKSYLRIVQSMPYNNMPNLTTTTATYPITTGYDTLTNTAVVMPTWSTLHGSAYSTLISSIPSEIPVDIDEQLHLLSTAPSYCKSTLEEMFLMNVDVERLLTSGRLDVILLVKAMFHDKIMNCKLTHSVDKLTCLIPRYNSIFNDGIYDKLDTDKPDLSANPEQLTDVYKQQFIAEYQKKVHDAEVVKRISAKPPKFKEGDIVGAQDKEGRWWLSHVLQVFSAYGQHVYYVEFKGWGSQFNEFITSPFKIRQFNPRKHKLYRAAWEAKKEDESESKEVNLDQLNDTDLHNNTDQLNDTNLHNDTSTGKTAESDLPELVDTSVNNIEFGDLEVDLNNHGTVFDTTPHVYRASTVNTIGVVGAVAKADTDDEKEDMYDEKAYYMKYANKLNNDGTPVVY